MKITDATEVKLTWIFDGECYRYHIVPGSLISNERKSSLRFRLEELDDPDDNFEVVIQKKSGSLIYRMDCFADANDAPLKEFKRADESILYFEDEDGEGFFTLSAD